MTNIGLGFEKKQHSMLVLCKTKDAVSGSELFIAHIVTVTLTQCQTQYRLINKRPFDLDVMTSTS